MSGITLTETAEASIPTPAATKATVFIDSASGEPSYKDDAGAVTSLVGTAGVGVPAGGSTGQALVKTSGTDYDTEWSGVLDTRGKQAIYIAAAAMRPSVSGGCAALAGIASAANMPDIVTLDFDTTTIENAQFGMVMPEKWNGGTLTFRYHWSHAAAVTNFGVVLGLQAVSVGDSDAIAVAYGTRVDITDTGGTTDDLFTSDESAAITVAGTPAGGEMVFFRLSRRAADGGDTLAVDARLHGVTVYCTTDQSTDV